MSATAPATVCASGSGLRVGFVLKGAIAMELEFGENVIGWGCRERRIPGLFVAIGRHGVFLCRNGRAHRGLRGDERRRADRTCTAKRPKQSGGWREPAILLRDVKRL